MNTAAVHGSFTMKRRYPAAVARVFAESDTHEIIAFESDFRVGGAELLTYRFGSDTPFPGAKLTNEGVYHDIVDQHRIVTSSRMAVEGAPISVALETIEIVEVDGETSLTCTFQGVFFEGADGPAMREQGWRDLLDRLGRTLAN